MEDINLNCKNNEGQKCKEQIKEINKLNLKQRKKEVQNELKNKNLNLEKLQYLLLLDNTNEDLLFRYMLASDKANIIYEMEKYSRYISLPKINEIQVKLLGDKNQDFRKISFKELFFTFLYAIHDNNKALIDKTISTIKLIRSRSVSNNQPFELNNFEAIYFYLCCCLVIQIDKHKEQNFDEYIHTIYNYVETISNILIRYKNAHYEEENKNIKKFLTVFFSIVNLDKENIHQISQVAVILKNPPSDEKLEKIISIEQMRFGWRFNEKGIDEFKKLIQNKKIYCDIKFKYSKGKIEIPEKCYLYDYIAEHNIFKKYENKLINLLKIILKSALFKDIVKMIYKNEDGNMKFFFEEEMTVEEFWHNKIIFIPFKIGNSPSFSCKDMLSIFFSFYKFKHFESEIENEIFTLGAFIRVMIYEIFGHLMESYFYFLFYSNLKKNDNISSKFKEQIKGLNKSNLYKILGNSLAEILCKNVLEIKTQNLFDDKISKEFEIIIGKEYTEKLIQKLIEDKKIDISKIKKENNTAELSIKIIDILMEFISSDFNDYISNINIEQLNYKEIESGNLVEFLLFNDFNQYITLKECLFLLNEEVYKETNIFKFRSEYKNLRVKNRDEFIKELIKDQKIFNDLFSVYNSLYEKHRNIYDDLTFPKNFRENGYDNLDKKIEPFKCFNFGLDRNIFFDNKKENP